MVAEEAVMMETVRAVESGTGKARSEGRAAHRCANMRTAELRAAAHMREGHAAAVHTATKTAMHAAAEAATVTTTAATAMAAATTAASGERRRRKRHAGRDHRSHETCEEPVFHREILRH